MKKSENKMIGEGDAENKGLPSSLVCVNDCVAPPYGEFKKGDKVTDPDAIAHLNQNSFYFQEIQEDK